MKRKERESMARVTVIAAAAAFLLLAGIAALAGAGIIVKAINQAHSWEEWSGQDDRKGVDV